MDVMENLEILWELNTPYIYDWWNQSSSSTSILSFLSPAAAATSSQSEGGRWPGVVSLPRLERNYRSALVHSAGQMPHYYTLLRWADVARIHIG